MPLTVLLCRFPSTVDTHWIFSTTKFRSTKRDPHGKKYWVLYSSKVPIISFFFDCNSRKRDFSWGKAKSIRGEGVKVWLEVSIPPPPSLHFKKGPDTATCFSTELRSNSRGGGTKKKLWGQAFRQISDVGSWFSSRWVQGMHLFCFSAKRIFYFAFIFSGFKMSLLLCLGST